MQVDKLAQERHVLFSVTSSLLPCTKQVTHQDKPVTLLMLYCPRNYSYDHKVPVKVRTKAKKKIEKQKALMVAQNPE